MTAAIQALLIANLIGYLLQMTVGVPLLEAFALWIDPAAPLTGVSNAPWQLVTYSLLHGNLAHLALNMFGLVMFGSEVESVWGPRRLLFAYFAAVLTAALAQIASAAIGDAGGPVIGASGGVFGLILCFGLLFPHRRVMLLFPPIPMSARTMVIVFAVLELTLGVAGTTSGVAHFAHLGGLLGGWLVYHYGDRVPRRRWR